MIKESLRIGPGIPAGLPRIVPPQCALIDGNRVAGGVSPYSPPFPGLAFPHHTHTPTERIHPQLTTTVQIPQTVVSSSIYFMHRNPSIFPFPDVFDPSRWEANTNPNESNKVNNELEKYLVPFSRGARMCLGFNLGWAELRLLFAHTFRKFELEAADER